MQMQPTYKKTKKKVVKMPFKNFGGQKQIKLDEIGGA